MNLVSFKEFKTTVVWIFTISNRNMGSSLTTQQLSLPEFTLIATFMTFHMLGNHELLFFETRPNQNNRILGQNHNESHYTYTSMKHIGIFKHTVWKSQLFKVHFSPIPCKKAPFYTGSSSIRAFVKSPHNKITVLPKVACFSQYVVFEN